MSCGMCACKLLLILPFFCVQLLLMLLSKRTSSKSENKNWLALITPKKECADPNSLAFYGWVEKKCMGKTRRVKSIFWPSRGVPYTRRLEEYKAVYTVLILYLKEKKTTTTAKQRTQYSVILAKVINQNWNE